MTAEAVVLGDLTMSEHRELSDLVRRAHEAAGDVPAALALAGAVGLCLPTPGAGGTARLWSTLATAAAADLTVARVLEPHLDALAILEQAGLPAATGTWGVFAAEGPGEPLRAQPSGSSYILEGRKHWCSLGAVLDHALISAQVDHQRQLFAVDLASPGVAPVTGTWVARGLSAVDSGPIDFDRAPATAVGAPGWYLDRPGFGWGGIGVAAVWFGGAIGLARRLRRSAGGRAPDQVATMHLGAVDAALHAAGCVLADAATAIDGGLLTGRSGAVAALRVRQTVALAAEEVLRRCAHDLGPGPLAAEEEHARRVADLELYLRQWHAERDQSALGALLLEDQAGAP